MKKIFRILTVLAAIALPFAAAHAAGENQLKKVESQYVCMINNKLFDKAQIPVIVGGKTYYGCCPMCKEKLEKSTQARMAIDPISNKSVDKATAVIGAEPSGVVHYFENEKNLQSYGK